MRQALGVGGITRVLALGALAVACAPLGSAGQERGPLEARGQSLFVEQGCYGCHTVGKMGTPIAPDLSAVGRKYREADLARWLSDPAAERPMRHMPRFALSEGDARALAAYLGSLR